MPDPLSDQHSAQETVQQNHACRSISKEMVFSKVFSICCLVRNRELYGQLRDVLHKQGFTPDTCEYLIADNCDKSNFNAYEAIRIFTRSAVGKYILILHQDAFPMESAEQLLCRIQQVESADPAWGVIGNAGKEKDNSFHGSLSLETHQGEYRLGKPFVKVQVLDENVIIVKNGLGITVSGDLEGFHFYGFDISSVAMRLGFSVYVIDFMWSHYSAGSIDESFIIARNAVEQKMRSYHTLSRASTTCTFLYWGTNTLESIMTMCRAVYMLDISPNHKQGTRLLKKNCAKKLRFFPLCYFVYRIRHFIICIFGWICYPFRVVYKVGSWHFTWWKKNWRSRLQG